MEIERAKFLDMLNKLKPGIAKKEIVEQATHIVFTEDMLVTYNDQICVVCPIDSDIEGSVPSDELIKVIQKMKSKEIELSILDEEDDGIFLLIESDRKKAKLAFSEDETISDLVKELNLKKAIKKMEELPDNFMKAIKSCVHTVSKDMTRPELTCLNIDDGVMIACDGFQIAKFVLSDDIEPFLFPGRYAEKLLGFPATSYYLDSEWVYFKTEKDMIFCSRIIDGEYEDYLEEFDVDGVRVKLPSGLSESVEAAAIFADGDVDESKKIDVVIEKGAITCKGENSTGSLEGKVESKALGKKKLTFSIHPSSLIAILESSSTMVCGEGKALFKSGDFEYLISLFD